MRVEAVPKVTADQSFAGVFEQGLNAHVGLDDAIGFRIHHEHRLGGGFKQHAIAGLDVAQAQVVSLDRLLGFDQTTL